ncbi:MAG: hypothetical protein ACLR1G_05925 [Alistipes indistinctus]
MMVFYDNEGYLIKGTYVARMNGTGSMHIAPAVVQGPSVQFKAVVGHEFIHAYHNHIGLKINNRFSEAVAYRFTAETYYNAGMFNEYENTVKSANAFGIWTLIPPASYRLTPFITF